MKIIVPVKRVLDYNLKPRIKSDGSDIDLNNVKMSLNPFDEIAIEEAVRLKEQGKASDIIAVTIGSEKSVDVLRTSLAMGADRAIHIIHSDDSLEPLAIAKLLKHIIITEEPDLILMGKQAIDDDYNQTGQMLAGLLGYPQATFASKIIVEDQYFQVTREVDGGLQTIQINKPAIITTDLRLNEPRYASLPNIMKAKRKPIDVKQINDFDVDIKPRLNILSISEPEQRQAGIIVETPKDIAEALKKHGGIA